MFHKPFIWWKTCWVSLLPWLVHQEGSLGKISQVQALLFFHWKLGVANDDVFFSHKTWGICFIKRYGMCVLKWVTLIVIKAPCIVSDCFDVRILLTICFKKKCGYLVRSAFEITRTSRFLFAGTFLTLICNIRTPTWKHCPLQKNASLKGIAHSCPEVSGIVPLKWLNVQMAPRRRETNQSRSAESSPGRSWQQKPHIAIGHCKKKMVFCLSSDYCNLVER